MALPTLSSNSSLYGGQSSRLSAAKSALTGGLDPATFSPFSSTLPKGTAPKVRQAQPLAQQPGVRGAIDGQPPQGTVVSATLTPVMANGLIPAPTGGAGMPSLSQTAKPGVTKASGESGGIIAATSGDRWSREEDEQDPRDPNNQVTPPTTGAVTGRYIRGVPAEQVYDAIRNAYQTLLGRAGSEQEIANWAEGPLDLGSALRYIGESDEAKAYKVEQDKKNATPLTWDEWFTKNPYPDGGTAEQRAAWEAEAAKYGWTPSVVTTTPDVVVSDQTNTTTTPPLTDVVVPPTVTTGPPTPPGTPGVPGNSGNAQGRVQDAIWAAVEALLKSPHSISPEMLAAMKEQQKETLLRTLQQGLGQTEQNAAARGMAQSNWLNAAELDQRQTFSADLTEAYRALMLEKAAKDRADEIAAMTAGDAALQNWFNRQNEAQKTSISQQAVTNAWNEFQQTLPLNWYQAISGSENQKGQLGLGWAQLNQQGQAALIQYLQSAGIL